MNAIELLSERGYIFDPGSGRAVEHVMEPAEGKPTIQLNLSETEILAWDVLAALSELEWTYMNCLTEYFEAGARLGFIGIEKDPTAYNRLRECTEPTLIIFIDNDGKQQTCCSFDKGMNQTMASEHKEKDIELVMFVIIDDGGSDGSFWNALSAVNETGTNFLFSRLMEVAAECGIAYGKAGREETAS